MIQFTLIELLALTVIFFTVPTVQFIFCKKKMIRLESENTLIKDELNWERTQMKMILQEIQTFKRVSEDLRRNATDLAIQLANDIKKDEEEFLDEVAEDLKKGKHRLN